MSELKQVLERGITACEKIHDLADKARAWDAIAEKNAEIERLRDLVAKREDLCGELTKQLENAQSTFRKVLNACNAPASHRAEQVRSEIVGIISAHLTDEASS